VRASVEMACLESAARLGPVPDGQLLFVNVSPSTLGDPSLIDILDRLPDRLVLEVSECEAVHDYDELRHHLAPWLERGVRLAVDDTGAGYSSLRHVIELAPDFLKLDREMVTGLGSDPIRRALVRAVVAFAREVGTHVIGEGVETKEDLEALQDAGVHFVQGYLFGRPGPDWAQTPRRSAPASPLAVHDPDLRALVRTLATCADAPSACGAVAEHLFRQGGLMPSIYLARGGSLRCVAQRGLWQVLDGMAGAAGVTGRTWATGVPIAVEDVRNEAHYLEAIPGVVSEVCVPIMSGEEAIGALNVESFGPMPAGMTETLTRYAAAIVDRLETIRYRAYEDPWHATARASVAISGLQDGPGLPRQALGCLMKAAEIDSGAIVLGDGQGAQMVATLGPLASTLAQLRQEELGQLIQLVERIRSCYSAGDPSGHCFVGTDTLREGGARAVVLLPLWSRKVRIGIVVLAHSRPVSISGASVEALEVLADHVAAIVDRSTRRF
jgi:EAL domain-containing protein (putative c-di-GMP-specific phosphodiesterase class I)/putative methionine-R-sulfoxide reductase with GAF domain